MLNKVIRMTAYDAKGREVRVVEFPKIAFNKDGSMGLLSSKTISEMLTAVETGGAMFIEKVWSK